MSLSYDLSTAIAEIRPWIGEHITVGVFSTKRDLKLVDVSSGGFPPMLGFTCFTYRKENRLSAAEKELITLGHINYAFSKPVSQGDDVLNYLPTQYLAESFKNAGFDGILYKSALTDKGKNVAIFNPVDAEVREGYIAYINKVKYDHARIGVRTRYGRNATA